MVLEISATPYIFTFKLYDWGRVGLDGKPRPINIARGKENIQIDRNTDWVYENCIHREKTIYQDKDLTIERTGLHELEFIETLRYSFTSEMHRTMNDCFDKSIRQRMPSRLLSYTMSKLVFFRPV